MCRRFIKENPALAAGIGLPVVLAILFSLAALIPEWTVSPPRYSLLFTIDDYTPNQNFIRLNVENGHLKAEYMKAGPNHAGNNRQRLYLFEASSQTTHEIQLTPPADGSSDQWQEFPVAETAPLTIDTRLKAPDGYEFRNRYNNGSMGWPFFYHNYGAQPSIAKDGRVIPIITDASGPYNYYSSKFIGWIIEGHQ